ncbi:MAG: succinate dehydrogenase, cytochrome b556 subunit [Chloroflexi bacterium]|nr:succinate dehydrogenase, cytochrome b556 subunit [Chloroflexota bacterium]
MVSTPDTNVRSPRHFWQWFRVWGRSPGMWAFALNRLAGIGLVFYLFLHLYVLHLLAEGPQAYEQFLALVRSPVFILGELLVVVGVLYHGLNGIRVALNGFGVAVPAQKALLLGVVGLVLIGGLVFALRMFAA